MNEVYTRTGQTIRQQRNALAEKIVARQYALQPDIWLPYGDRGREVSVRDASSHLGYLAESLTAAEPSLFIDYVSWAKALFAGLKFSQDVLITTLQCTRDVLADSLPRDLASAAGEYLASGLDQVESAPEIPQEYIEESQPLSGLAREYLGALLRVDRNAAHDLVMGAAKRGARVQDIYLQVFARTQEEVGRLWQIGQLTVAQEHFCTAATQRTMAELYAFVFRSRAPRAGRSVVVLCVTGELHELGARIVADFFEMEGWDAYYLGANVPAAGLAQTIAAREVQAIAISTSMTFHLSSLREMIGVLRAAQATGHLPIIVGGYPFNVASHLWSTVGADGSARNAEDALVLGRELAASRPPRSRDRHQRAGTVWVSDQAGQTLEVIQDDLGWLAPGNLLSPEGGLGKVAGFSDFLATLIRHGQVLDWSLPAQSAGRAGSFHLAGMRLGERSLIMAANSARRVRHLCQELASGPTEWAQPLRGVLDEWAELSSRQVRKGTGLYDELSRLNNELLNLQRELARKNAELEAMRDAPSDLPSRGA